MQTFNFMYRCTSCQVPVAKCSFHTVSLTIVHSEQFGIDLHSLTATILVGFKTDFHWKRLTLFFGTYRLRTLSGYSSDAVFHDHQEYVIPCTLRTRWTVYLDTLTNRATSLTVWSLARTNMITLFCCPVTSLYLPILTLYFPTSQQLAHCMF